jgi:hypothetical protein
VSKTALIGWSLAFGLGVANVAELGSQGIQRVAIGLGISAIMAIVRMADEARRPPKSLNGAAAFIHKLGTAIALAATIAWAAGYAAPWSGYAAILAGAVALAAWYSVYLPRWRASSAQVNDNE